MNDQKQHLCVLIPRVVRGECNVYISINIDWRSLGANSFLRIDAYPTIAPKHMKRHYGYVDIPLEEIRTTEECLAFDGKKLVLHDKEYVFSLPFFEEGNIIWHLSLWSGDTLLHFPIIQKRFSYFYVNEHPIFKHAIITTSERCNLRCSMCGRQSSKHSAELLASQYMLTPEEARTLAARYRDLKSVILLGSGEPLLNKHIFELIAIFRESMGEDAELNLGTNATLLTSGIAERLALSGLSGCGFSVDGASAASYESIRIGAHFKKTIKNITFFVDLIRKRNIPLHVWGNYVIQPANIHECAKFVSLCSSIGIADVRFSIMMDYKHHYDKNFNLHAYLIDTYNSVDIFNTLSEIKKEVSEVAQRNGIQCSFENLEVCDTQQSANKGELFCPFIEFLPLFLRNTPFEYFCCNNAFQPKKQNKYQYDPFENIRMEILRGNFGNICSQCHMRLPL